MLLHIIVSTGCTFVFFHWHKLIRSIFNPIPPGPFEYGAAWGGGGVGGIVPAGYSSKTINDNEMKLGGVVKDH